MPVKRVVGQTISLSFGKSGSETIEFVVKPVGKFPTKYVALGVGLSLAAILGIVLVRKKKG